MGSEKFHEKLLHPIVDVILEKVNFRETQRGVELLKDLHRLLKNPPPPPLEKPPPPPSEEAAQLLFPLTKRLFLRTSPSS